MKRHFQTVGVRTGAGDALVELQSGPLAALDAFFSECGPCVLQGCEITESADNAGTFDIAPGLVALEAEDRAEGGRRVMVMPFGGAKDVALPLYLTASVETRADIYGDGKSKPITYIYTAQAAGVEPGDGVPYLTLSAEGGNRFVDAVQDAGHRFISDDERAKWNRILEQAKSYADSVAAVGSEAALRNAKEYTDARETAILAAADAKDESTLRTAKEYADRIVAALAGSAPELMDTLEELAAALGNDPNFAAKVMQLVSERVTKEELSKALEGVFKTIGNGINADDAKQGAGYSYSEGTPTHGTVATFKGLPTDGAYGALQLFCDNQETRNARFWVRNNNQQGFTPWVELWHSGNFDPNNKIGRSDGSEGNPDQTTTGSSSCRNLKQSVGVATDNYHDIYTLSAYGIRGTQIIREIDDNTAFYIRGTKAWTSTYGPAYRLYHSGNLKPATAAADGLMSAADKQKIDGISGVVAAGKVSADGGKEYATPGVGTSYNTSSYFYTITFPYVANPIIQVTPFDCPDKAGTGAGWGKVCCIVKTLTTTSAKIIMTDSAGGAHIRAPFCFSILSV